MTKRLDFPVDEGGDIVTQKVIVGCDKANLLGGRSKGPLMIISLKRHGALRGSRKR
jgi:hypothetical protein